MVILQRLNTDLLKKLSSFDPISSEHKVDIHKVNDRLKGTCNWEQITPAKMAWLWLCNNFIQYIKYVILWPYLDIYEIIEQAQSANS